jgi:hypothetical protein
VLDNFALVIEATRLTVPNRTLGRDCCASLIAYRAGLETLAIDF